MFGIGAPELLIVLVILLLLFGGAKLPQLSRSIGQSLRELRGGFEDNPAEGTRSRARAKKSDPTKPSSPKSVS